MPWNLPIFALALALVLGVAVTMPGRSLGMNAIPASSFNLFRGTQASALAMATMATACGQSSPALVPSPTKPSPTKQDAAFNWAASLRGWPEGPTVRAWRHFAGWSKLGWHRAWPCAGPSPLA